MFDALGKQFSAIFSKFKNKGIITEQDLDSAMREIRLALLQADVALPVIKEFIDKVKQDAIGEKIIQSVSPEQMIIKIVHNNLVSILSHEKSGIWNFYKKPSIVLMAGLQGSGKTTMSAKLAYLLKKENKKILLASCDIYRPAAMEQLAILSSNIGCDCLEIIPNQTVKQISDRILEKSKEYDVVIIDTAGRMHINDELMDEISIIKQQVNPQEILFIADALSGQDIFNTAKKFHEVLGLTGICLSRIDGDGRGGAALSIKYITQCPIKILGTGEKPEQSEHFDAKRIADRILDMGDIVSFVEKASENISENEIMSMFEKMQSGIFDMDDFLKHIQSMNKMGGIASILSFMPGMRDMKEKLGGKIDKDVLKKPVAIIQSMNKKEKKNPNILNASRKKRIAAGSGTTVQDINKLLQQYEQIKKMMKSFCK